MVVVFIFPFSSKFIDLRGVVAPILSIECGNFLIKIVSKPRLHKK